MFWLLMRRTLPTDAYRHGMRLLSLLLCLCLFVGCKATTEEMTDTETAVTTAETTQNSQAEETYDMNVWIANGFDKITDDMKMPEGASQTVDIYMAKNESEGCQIALRAPERITGISMECTDAPENAPTVAIFREQTVRTGDVYTPDALAPFSGKLTMRSNTTQVLYLDFSASKDAAAGVYPYTFTVFAGESAIAACTVNVHVWDFALPDAVSCETAVGLYKAPISQMHNGVEGEALDALYKAYYDTMLSYKVCAYDLPYDILDDRADAYMSDPRVTSFRVPIWEEDDARLASTYEKLCSNPTWLAKAYFYPLDEPTSKDMLNTLADLCVRLQSIAPKIRICTPFFKNIDYDKDTDQITFMTGKTTLWCPKSYMYITSNIYSPAQLLKYPKFDERMAERKAAGDDVWWYVCWEPGDPYNNLFVDQKGVQHRILFWQQFAYHVDGFLYWGANYWGNVADPWASMVTVPELSTEVYGDGSLLYNGSHVGLEDACPSLRLIAVRDGVDDFEMLRMAEETFGRDWVDEKIAKVTPSLTNYSKNSTNFETIRREIGEALSGS